MKEREALKLALEALEDRSSLMKWQEARDAVKEALAQPVSSHGNAEDLYVEMSKHLNCPHCGGSGHVDDVAQQCVCGEPNSAGTHRTDGPCLAPQPEQEPVAWRFRSGTWFNREAHWRYINTLEGTDGLLGLEPLYTTPPQRTWVGLTDEEKSEIAGVHYARTNPLIAATEAKLKEKNT